MKGIIMSMKMIMNLLFVVVTIFTISTSTLVYANDVRDVKDVISEYEKNWLETQATMETSFFEAEWNIKSHGAIASHAPQQEDNKFTFIRDKTRFDVKRERLHFDKEGNINAKKSRQSRQIVDGKQSLLRTGNLNELPDYILAFPPSSKTRARTYGSLGDIRILDGYLRGDEDVSLSGILQNAASLQLRDSMDVVDGHKVYVVEADTLYGKYVVWLDPMYGYMPRRITIHKTGNDLHNGKPLNSPPPKLITQRPYYPHEPLQEYSVIVDSIEIEKTENRFLLTACHVTRTRTYNSGKIVIFDSHIKRTNTDLNPDFEKLGAFIMDAPDGTRVFHTEFMDIPFEWRGGKVVTVIDQPYIDIIDDVTQDIKNEAKGNRTATNKDEHTTTNKKVKVPTRKSLPNPNISQDISKIEGKPVSKSTSISTFLLWIGIAAVLVILVAGCFMLRQRKGGNHDET
ncbi:MAG: hypothetical protein JSW07_04605 [bacterium]|nr:MAG: hypothetical protein JSW07_04605 [bacterium]